MTHGARIEDADKTFHFWLQALRHSFDPDHCPPPEHRRGRAEAGYWRHRTRDGIIRPFFVWRVHSGQLCWIHDHTEAEVIRDEEAFCERLFAYALRHPIHASEYKIHRLFREWSADSLERYEAEDRRHKQRIRG